jgi:hypothetical protein
VFDFQAGSTTLSITSGRFARFCTTQPVRNRSQIEAQTNRSTTATTIASLVDRTLLDREDVMHDPFGHRSADHATSEGRSTGPQPTTPQRPPRDLPGQAQVFGAVFTVLLAAVVSATLSGVVVAILTAAAAGCVCVMLYVATNHRPWTQVKQILVASLAASSLALAGVAVAVAVSGNQHPASGTAASSGPETGSAPSEPQTAAPQSPPSTTEPQQREPIVAKTNYQLIPSSNPLTNDADKVDLDTGCPGWGPTSVQVGRDRCGEAADLILESTNLHTYEELPRLAVLDGGQEASWTTCHEVLEADNATVGTVQLSVLRPGLELCVLTDKDNIAAVHVVSMSSADVVIGFEVWAR